MLVSQTSVIALTSSSCPVFARNYELRFNTVSIRLAGYLGSISYSSLVLECVELLFRLNYLSFLLIWEIFSSSGVIHSTAGKDAGLVPCRSFSITLDTLYECFGVRFSAPWFTHMWLL